MPSSDTDVVVELADAIEKRDFRCVVALLAENFFARLSTGQIYVGSTGLSNWISDAARMFESRRLELLAVRPVAPEFVLLEGVEHQVLPNGEHRANPGFWLHHVRNGRVNAIVYFRTEHDALASLAAPGRSEPAVDLVDRMIDAFNREDYVAIIRGISADYRFDSAIVEPGVVREGLDAVLRRLIAVKDSYEALVIESARLEDLGGGYVLAEGVLRTEQDGETSRRDATWLARVEDDRVKEFLLHADRESALRRVAERPQPSSTDPS